MTRFSPFSDQITTILVWIAASKRRTNITRIMLLISMTMEDFSIFPYFLLLSRRIYFSMTFQVVSTAMVTLKIIHICIFISKWHINEKQLM